MKKQDKAQARIPRRDLGRHRIPRTLYAILIAILILSSGAATKPAFAATATLAASSLTAPQGVVWLPGSLGGHLWIVDHLQGFCRLDPGVLPNTLVVNAITCNTAARAPGQPSFDGTGFVYLPDIAGDKSGAPVWRLAFNPATETVGSPTLILPGDPMQNDKPAASAMGPDGKLYLGFLTTGVIRRIANPDGVLPTAETVGTDLGGLVSSLAFVGNNLYVAGAASSGLISNAAACVGACIPSAVAAIVSAPTALAADGTLLYIGTASAVWRHDTVADTTVLYANGGTSGAATLPFQNVSALGFNLTTGDLYVGDDPSAGALALRGRLWQILAGAAPGATLTGMVLATQAATGVTAPAGPIWLPGALGGHFWIADHVLGFCRLDPGVLPNTLVLNAITCNTAATAPGQPSFDGTGFVYLPDIAGDQSGAPVWRLAFNPATETVGSPTPVLPGNPMQNDKPAASAMGPDGKLYLGFLTTGVIRRIANPDGFLPAAETVGTDLGGLVSSLAFVGNNLYVAGAVSPGLISNAAACVGVCIPSAVAPIVSAPTAFAYDGVRYLYVSDSSTVWRYNAQAGTTELYSNSGLVGVTVEPFQNISGLGLDVSGTLFVADDPTAGGAVLQGHIWAATPYILPIHDAKSGVVGTMVTYTLSISNTSGVADTFNLSYTGNAWSTTGPASVGPLAPGVGANVTVQVTVPTGILPFSDTVMVSASAGSNASKFTSTNLTTSKVFYKLYFPMTFKNW